MPRLRSAVPKSARALGSAVRVRPWLFPTFLPQAHDLRALLHMLPGRAVVAAGTGGLRPHQMHLPCLNIHFSVQHISRQDRTSPKVRWSDSSPPYTTSLTTLLPNWPDSLSITFVQFWLNVAPLLISHNVVRNPSCLTRSISFLLESR